MVKKRLMLLCSNNGTKAAMLIIVCTLKEMKMATQSLNLVQYVDYIMLIDAKKRSIVDVLTKQLKSTFSMKDLGEAEHLLGVRIRIQREQHTLYLSKEKYIEKVMDKFCMVYAKPLRVPLKSYDKIFKEDCPKTQEQSMTCKVYLLL